MLHLIMKLRVALLTVLVILYPIPQDAHANPIKLEGYLIQLDFYTDSDWTTFILKTSGKINHLDYEFTNPQYGDISVSQNQSSVSINVQKKGYDQTPVMMSIHFLLTTIDPTLKTAIFKGGIGLTNVKFYVINELTIPFESLSHAFTLNKQDTNPFYGSIDGSNLRPYGFDLNSLTLPIEPLVLACYYPWYSTPSGPGGFWDHWSDVSSNDSGLSINFPLIGAYDSQDPQIVTTHIQMAKLAGIDGFLCSWSGIQTNGDKALRVLLESSDYHNYSIAVYYESLRNIFEPVLDQNQIIEELVYITKNYSKSSSYLHVDGKPVIFIYQAETMGRSPDFWREIRIELEKKVGQVILVGEFRDMNYYNVFDGSQIYIELNQTEHQLINEKIKQNRELFIPESWSEIVNSVRMNNSLTFTRKITVGTVIPGYDDTEIRDPGQIVSRNGMKTYRSYWDYVQMNDPDWVMITSWNEWHEGTEIEPSMEHRFNYLIERL